MDFAEHGARAPGSTTAVGRRSLLAGTLALAATAALPGVVRAAGTGKLVYMSPAPFALSFAEVLIGIAHGHFKAAGIEVEALPGSSGIQPMQQLLSGQIDVGRTAAILMANSVAKGVTCRAIATLSHRSPLFIISAAAAPIREPKDLAGAAIGITSPNDPTDLMLKAMIASGGLADADVRREISADNAGSFALVEVGRIKGFIGNSEAINRAKGAGADVVAVNLTEFMPLPGQVYVAMNEEIDGNEAELVAFLRGVRAAITDIVDDPGYGKTFATLRELGLKGLDNVETARIVMKANVDNWLAAGADRVLYNVPENWQHGMEAAVKIGALPDIPQDKLYTNTLVEKALGG